MVDSRSGIPLLPRGASCETVDQHIAQARSSPQPHILIHKCARKFCSQMIIHTWDDAWIRLVKLAQKLLSEGVPGAPAGGQFRSIICPRYPFPVWLILHPGSYLWKSGLVFSKNPGEIQVFKEKNYLICWLQKIEQNEDKHTFKFFQNLKKLAKLTF